MINKSAILSLESFVKRSIYTMFEILHILFASLSFKKVNLPIIKKKNAIIMGNGPSLKITFEKEIDKFWDFDTFCVNNFSLSKEYELVKPNHYVLLDPGYWDIRYLRNEQEIILVKDSLNAICIKTTWPLNLFIPVVTRKSGFIDSLKLPSCINVFYFYNIPLRGYLRNQAAKLNLGILGGQNVLHACITLAINCGYQDVFIVGADHSWFEDIRFDVDHSYIKDRHFFENKNEVIAKHPKNALAISLITLGKCLLSYHDLYGYAKYRSVRVLNASQKSYIDVFPFVKL